MTLQKKFFTLLLVSAFFLQGSIYAQSFTETNPEEVGFSNERLQYLTNTFENFVQDDALPGSVILVARKGKIAYYNAFGKRDIQANDKMEKTDVIRLY